MSRRPEASRPSRIKVCPHGSANPIEARSTGTNLRRNFKALPVESGARACPGRGQVGSLGAAHANCGQCARLARLRSYCPSVCYNSITCRDTFGSQLPAELAAWRPVGRASEESPQSSGAPGSCSAGCSLMSNKDKQEHVIVYRWQAPLD